MLSAKEYNETLDSLDKKGWGYVLMLYEFKMLGYSVEQAWNLHRENEDKKNKR